ncbi:putative zinc metalloprotease [Microthyrium microscopicum]|uniref:Putative zinc metalloprotease n=1 Tax=Microthyrium microscopicum TaxID=703497 RepID=A0A6A6UKE9_9PEZI|nr:putative zinc metalloprotease [Microthyrium microscopicum]
MTRPSGFKKIQHFTSSYAGAKITQYESLNTGMRVIVLDRQSTKVNGDFCLATEIHDDSGAPHTLEHLIFMGSKTHQYKGVLDKLANRAYSSTNAWTATDHTNYTLETAGWAGFAQILPIYLEHVILPTLTDSGCYTEVHHIDGEGNDAGVVYSEMQALENNSGELMDIESKRLMFPEPIGFRYETGGLTPALRVLTNEKIREFHKLMYQPKNLRVMLCGQVDHNQLLEILDKFESTILPHVPKIDEPFKRPWVDSEKIPSIKENIVKRIEFPEEDESIGEVSVNLFGPDCLNHLEVRALTVITEYLSGSSAALLQNVLVEKEQLASSVDVYLATRPKMLISIQMSSVETEKLEAVEKRLWEVLETALSEPLDMQYLLDCLRRLRKRFVYEAECRLDFFTDDVICDHLYASRDGKDLEDALESLEGYEILEHWSEAQWKEFITKYFIKNPHVSILGVPSMKVSEDLKAAEKERIEKRLEKLGPDGLKELATKLEAAKKANDVPVPDGLFQSLPVPSSDTIPWISTTTAQSGLAKASPPLQNSIQKIVDKDSKIPLSIHFEHTQAKCVYFSVVLFSDKIPIPLMPLLNVYQANFFSTPIMRNGVRLEFEDMIKDLERDTISYSFECCSFNHTESIRLKFVVETEKYATGISWLRDLVFNKIFDPERLKISVGKLLADIPVLKRDGSNMAQSVDNMIHYIPQSSVRAQNTLVNALYLKRIKRMLNHEPDTVIKQLETLCQSLYTFDNIRCLVTADVESLSHPVYSWDPFLSMLIPTSSLRPIRPTLDFRSEAANKPGGLSYIIPMATNDSAYAYFTTRTITGFSHPRLPALLIALSYLDATDGPLWTAVRGSGLAYGTNFEYSCSTGTLKLSIYRSPEAYKAFEASKHIVSEFVNGTKKIDEFAMEGAVSNVVLSYANEQTTIIQAALLGFVNPVILGIPRDYSVSILREVKKVSGEEVVAAMREFILPVFDPKTANMVVTCAPAMKEGLVENFKGKGFKAEVQTLDFFQDDYGLKAVGDEEDDDEDDEEDDDDEDDDEEEEDESDKSQDEK